MASKTSTSEDAMILVTGASGYISTHVVKLLQEQGHKVRGTVRSTKNEAKVKHLYDLCPDAKYPLELVEADLTKEDGWDKAVEGCTFVHHIASPYLLTEPKDENEMIKPAVEGTLVVLKACAKAGTVKRVILTSSITAISTGGGNAIPRTERDWADPNFANIPTYNKSKILAERAAWEYLDTLPDSQKFELAVVNPSGVFGPVLHGTPGSSTKILCRLLNREMRRIPALSMSFVDVRDCAIAHLKCQTMPEAAGQRHILHTKEMWFADVAKLLDKEFKQYGYNIPTGHLPWPIFAFATWFDKALYNARVLGEQPMNVDNSRMTKVLGITPTDPDKTLIDMAYTLIDKGFVAKTPGYKPREQ